MTTPMPEGLPAAPNPPDRLAGLTGLRIRLPQRDGTGAAALHTCRCGHRAVAHGVDAAARLIDTHGTHAAMCPLTDGPEGDAA